MPRGEDPLFRAPNFFIVAMYPRREPHRHGKLVADPIEEKLNEARQHQAHPLRHRRRPAGRAGRVHLQRKAPYNEVVREVNSLRPALPADLLSLEIRKVTASDVSTLPAAFVTDSAGSYRAL